MEHVKLNNGIEMPMLGYGVFQIPDAAECERCVRDAIDTGYRLIDTAQAYGNEEAVGKAIAGCGVPREDLFVTTKVWISNGGSDKARKSIEASLHKLGTEYVDLMLIHQPFNDYYGTWRTMEEMYREGKLRAIGVSNFYPDRLIDLIKFNEIVPAVNQVETHPFQQQKKAREVMAKYGVQVEAWGPFAEGRNNLFSNETLVAVGEKHGKSAAQVTLRFLLQNGVVVIPKTVNKDRMAQNLDVFDFVLDADDLEKISALDTSESLFFSHYDPDTVERLTGLVR